jgi:hypothetical protein
VIIEKFQIALDVLDGDAGDLVRGLAVQFALFEVGISGAVF